MPMLGTVEGDTHLCVGYRAEPDRRERRNDAHDECCFYAFSQADYERGQHERLRDTIGR